MAVPTISDSATNTQNTNTTTVAVDISGWTLAEGDLLVVFGTVDGAEAGNTAITQTGFTEHWSTESSGALITGCCYSKELVSGDTSLTEIELTWTGNEKAVLRVIRIASGGHNGIDAAGTPNANTADTAPDLPSVTYGTDTLSLGHAAINGAATVSVNPTGYATDDQTSATGGGLVTQWVGTDELSGVQSAQGLTISAAQDSITGIIGIAAAAGSSPASFYYYE